MIAADIDRDIAALPALVKLAARFFHSHHDVGHARYAVELALEEVFTNMVKYNAGAGPIRVTIDRRRGEIVLTLTDSDAPPFDPFTEVPETVVTGSLAERAPGGLGIHLVRKMMDRIEYSHRDRTATVTLHKRIS